MKYELFLKLYDKNDKYLDYITLPNVDIDINNENFCSKVINLIVNSWEYWRMPPEIQKKIHYIKIYVLWDTALFVQDENVEETKEK